MDYAIVLIDNLSTRAVLAELLKSLLLPFQDVHPNRRCIQTDIIHHVNEILESDINYQ